MSKIANSAQKRKFRVRKVLKSVAYGRPRLSVHRSSKQIYAQVIDDVNGVTLAAACSLEKVAREKLKSGANILAANEVGLLIAERALKAGVKEVIFDRGQYIYHGRVKALADAARSSGLVF